MLPPPTHTALNAIITSLSTHHTSGGGNSSKRHVALLFLDLPDRELYPDYYVLIKEPRCLHDIQESLKKGSYSSPQAVAYDLFLVWQNAREYNEQGSQVYKDADRLEAHMAKLWKDKTPPLPAFTSLPRPGTLGFDVPAKPEKPAPKIKLKSSSLIAAPAAPSPAPSSSKTSSKSHRGNAPTRASAILARDPSRIPAPVTAPAPVSTSSTPSITLKLGPRAGTSTTASTSSSTISASTTTPFNKIVLPVPSTSAQPTDMQPKVEEATDEPLQSRKRPRDDEDGIPTPATPKLESKKKKEEELPTPGSQAMANLSSSFGIPDDDPGWLSGDLGPDPKVRYRQIVRQLTEHTDVHGRRLSGPLQLVPDRTERPDYYSAVSDPISFSLISERIENNHYATPEAFDRDLKHLFDVAKIFVKPDTPGVYYTDLIVLQRLYHTLTRRGQSTSLNNAADAASLSSVAVGPGKIQARRGESPSGGADAEGHRGFSNPRVTIKDKIFLDGINFKGDYLRTGDWVHLLNPDNPSKPIIAQIFKTWKRADSPQRCISVCWYYRPEETVHPASRQFYENEVFKTSNFVDHSVEDFVERCFVMFFTRYVRGRPKTPAYNPQLPLYVCEHRYKDDVKTFKKIKNWNSCVPEEIRKNEYELQLFDNDRIEQPRRVKSPFVRGVAGPGGIGHSAEVEEEEQARYHFMPDGEPATAQKLKAIRDQQQAEAQAELSTHVVHNVEATVTPAETPAVPLITPPLPPPPPAQPLIVPGTTVAETAIVSETFHPLPASIRNKFRSIDGDLLWFAAPALSLTPLRRPTHSTAYMQWRAARDGKGQALSNGTNGDVDMVDVP